MGIEATGVLVSIVWRRRDWNEKSRSSLNCHAHVFLYCIDSISCIIIISFCSSGWSPKIRSGAVFSSMVLVESRKRTYASAIGDTGDKVELPPKRHANASRLVTPKAKDGVATTPNMPRAWSDTFLTDKPAECVEEYVGVMVHSVSIRLHECLSQAPTRGGISLQGPLLAQTSIDVAKANRNIDVKSYKEALKKKANCLKKSHGQRRLRSSRQCVLAESCFVACLGRGWNCSWFRTFLDSARGWTLILERGKVQTFRRYLEPSQV